MSKGVWRAFAILGMAALWPAACSLVAEGLAAESFAAGSFAVEGSVTDLEGAPLTGAAVELLPVVGSFERARLLLEEGRADPEPVGSAAADAAGRFRLDVARAGMWAVVARAPGYVPMRLQPLALVGPRELPPVALAEDAGTRLRVLEPSGGPSAGTWVVARSADGDLWSRPAHPGWRPNLRSGRLGESGRLDVPRAARELLNVWALPGRRAPVHFAAVGGAEPLTLPPPGPERTIEVHGPDGEPLAGVVVGVGDLGWPLGRTDAAGRLTVRAAGEEPLRLHLLSEDRSREVSLVPDAAAAEVSEPAARFVLPPAERAVVRVLDAGGEKPLAGALVWTGDDPGLFGLTDARGEVALPVRSGKRSWVQAHAAGSFPRIGWVERRPERRRKDPAVALTPASRLEGLVVDGEGRAVAGARLSAAPDLSRRRPPLFRLDPADGRARSGAEGRFVLEGLAAGDGYELAAAKPGFGTARLAVETVGRPAPGSGAPPPPLRIVLWPARPAFGRVVDAEEKPLAEVVVTVDPSASPGERKRPGTEALTDGAGRFELAELPSLKVDLGARKEGYSPLTVRGVEAPAGEGAIDLGTLVLVPGTALHGVVSDPLGKPIAEASVWLREDRGRARPSLEALRQEDPVAVTDAEGGFLVEDLLPHTRVHLAFGAEGYLSAALLGLALPHEAALEVVLEPGSGVSGRVLDEAFEPVAEARVSLHGRDLPPGEVDVQRRQAEGSKSVTTDALGRFLIAGVAPGGVEVEAFARGFQPSEPRALELPPGGRIEGIELVLERGETVEGLVTGREGDPVAGARLALDRLATTSAEDGSYRLEGAALGLQTLLVLHRGYERLEVPIEVAPGINQRDVVLDGGFRMAGTAFGQEGEPLAGVRVELILQDPLRRRSYRAATDPEGRFEVAEALAGLYDLTASRAGYATAEEPGFVELPSPGAAALEVRLRRGAVLEGRILGLGFEELAAVRVEAQRGGQLLEGTVDYAGHYAVRDLGAGDWLVEAGLEGGSRQAQARVVVEPGSGRIRRDLELGNGFTLTGTVLLGDAPLAGAAVSAAGYEVAVRRAVVTDHLGRFRMRDLEEATYRVSVSHSRELVTHTEEVEVSADRDLEIRIATGRVRGRVVSAATDEPVPEAQVVLQRMLGADASVPGPVVQTGTSAEGRFAMARAVAGFYRLRVSKSGYAPAEQSLEVGEGEELPVEVALSPTEGLALTVSLASGKRPSFAALALLDGAGQPVSAESRFLEADGRVHFSTVPAGSWELLVAAPGGAPSRLSAQVPGPPLEVVLPLAGRLRVEVASLQETDRAATLTVLGSGGRPLQALDEAGTLTRAWRLEGGATTVESIPEGAWALRVEAVDGQVWEGAAATAAGGSAAVRLE